jgi:integrin alpha FG-GAP repeat containing protein 1
LQFYPSRSLVANVSGVVEGVVPGDYDYDGQLDLLVTWKSEASKFMQIFLQTGDTFTSQKPLEIPWKSHPVSFDIDGDLKLEVISNLNDSVAVFDFEKALIEKSDLSLFAHSESKTCLKYSQVTFSMPHSVAFVDLNKDCRADLFLTVLYGDKTFFEVWLNAKDGTFCKVLSEEAPAGARQVNFVDFDRDGIEDVVFPVCLGEDCLEKSEIHVVYNQNEGSNDCSFSFDKLGHFELKDISSTESTKHKIVIKMENPFFLSQEFPVTLRFGDFDLDGFPDALAILSNNSESFVQYLKNSDCGHCKPGRRTLQEDSSSDFEKLSKIENAVLACFFDLDDKGVLDIIVGSIENSTYKITGFYNNFQSDAFHLKALALNGHSRGGYSSAYPGAVFMFTLTELDMSKVVIHSTQMPLTAFFALGTPYCVFGLGRTNSYVEEFYAGLPLEENSYRSWTPIIPNSYLIVSPDKTSSDEWFLELFASPTDQIGVIIGVCCVCMLVIGIVVVIKYYKEKKEDKQLFGIKF